MRNSSRSVTNFLFLTALFAVAYTQAPLYTSNQNQYFLHGLAHAGVGYLRQDWLANTLDPTPVFSLLVSVTYTLFASEVVFYVYYALQMGVYLFSLLGIVATVFDIHSERSLYLVFLALLVTAHSAALRFALARALGANWTYVFEDGVADQRLLGSVFEPSTFSVLLVFSIYLFLAGRPLWAVLAAVLAATFHPTYLLSAAVLTLAYAWTALREAGGRRGLLKALLIGTLALAAVSPILFYVYTNFANTPADTTAQARQILVDFRIPHHARVAWWFDATAIVKILLVSAGLALARRTRLFPVLLFSTAAAVGLTILQLVLNHDALALIFPWRLSIYLVPISTAALLAYLVTALGRSYPSLAVRYRRSLTGASLILLGLVVLIGGIRFVLDLQRKANAEDRPVMAYVAAHSAPGEIYLIPVKMQDFRLAAGSPAFVDFKSIPYRDSDVLEWYRRLQLTDRFYKQNDCSLLQQLAREEGITHVVLRSEQFGLQCPALNQLYRDSHYGVYTLGGRAQAP